MKFACQTLQMTSAALLYCIASVLAEKSDFWAIFKNAAAKPGTLFTFRTLGRRRLFNIDGKLFMLGLIISK